MPKKIGSMTTLEKWYANGEVINNVSATTGTKFEFECSQVAFAGISTLITAGILAMQAHNYEDYLRNGLEVGDISVSTAIQELFTALLAAKPLTGGNDMACCPKELHRIAGDGVDYLGIERYDFPIDAEHVDIYDVPDCACQLGYLQLSRFEFTMGFSDCTMLFVASPNYTYPVVRDPENYPLGTRAVDMWDFIGLMPNVKPADTNIPGAGQNTAYPPPPTQQNTTDPAQGQPDGWQSDGGSSYGDEDEGASGGFDYDTPDKHDWQVVMARKLYERTYTATGEKWFYNRLKERLEPYKVNGGFFLCYFDAGQFPQPQPPRGWPVVRNGTTGNIELWTNQYFDERRGYIRSNVRYSASSNLWLSWVQTYGSMPLSLFTNDFSVGLSLLAGINQVTGDTAIFTYNDFLALPDQPDWTLTDIGTYNVAIPQNGVMLTTRPTQCKDPAKITRLNRDYQPFGALCAIYSVIPCKSLQYLAA